MTEVFYYMMKMVICSVVLYLYYWLALRNRVFHQWNRFYLLFSVAASLLLPMLRFNLTPAEDSKNAMELLRMFQSADNTLENFTVTSEPPYSYNQWLLLGYSIVSATILATAFIAILRIIKLMRNHAVQRIDEIKFVNTTEPGTPFSFLRYIFWNSEISLQSETGQQIFRHELVHVEERHTWDKLFMQAILILFWMNPVFWLIRKELSFIHEFIADKKAVGQKGAAAFAAMILQSAYPSHYQSIVNPFFQTSIKRRLAMLTKIQNPMVNYICRIVALPLLAITVFAFSVRTNAAGQTSKQQFSQDLSTKTSAADTVPKKEIASVDVYKDPAGKANKLTISYVDGTKETLTEQEAREKGYFNEAYINEPKGKKPVPTQPFLTKSDSAVQPIFILDGKEIPKLEMNKINPNTIKSINVLKGKSATDKYGVKGINGVVEITSKTTDGKTTSADIEKLDINVRANDEKDLSVLGYLKPIPDQTNVDKNKEVVVTGHKIQKQPEEITVVGYATRKDDREPIFTQAETPATVDQSEWQAFLSKNLIPIIKNTTSKGAAPGKYTISIRFLVRKDGSLSDFEALNNPGYELDKQILAFMPNSPKWKPAMQNNMPVNSYHTQPITFQIADNN